MTRQIVSTPCAAPVLIVLLLLLGPLRLCAAQVVEAHSAATGTGTVSRQSDGDAAPAPPSWPDKTVTLDFQDVSVATLGQFFHHLTGKEYVFAGSGWERLDLRAEQRLSIDEAEKVYFSALEALGYHVADDVQTVRITPEQVRAVQVEGTLASLPSEPLTSGQRQHFQALCSGAEAWILIRAPERACGLSWLRASSGDGFVYFPWKRRVRKIDAHALATRAQFGVPVALGEVFDVVCETVEVTPAHARYITIDRRTATTIGRGYLSINGLIDSVQKLGCTARAGTSEAETRSAAGAD